MKCVRFVCAMYCQQLKLALKCNTPIKLHNICIKNSNIKKIKIDMKSNTTNKNQPEKDMNILTDFKNLMKKCPIS